MISMANEVVTLWLLSAMSTLSVRRVSSAQSGSFSAAPEDIRLH